MVPGRWQQTSLDAPFSVALDRPGAWDFVSYFDLRIDPGYTISVVDRGVPVDFVCVDKLWNPATLRSLFRSGDLEMLEGKALLKEDFLVSRLTLTNNSKEAKELDIVVWRPSSVPTATARSIRR